MTTVIRIGSSSIFRVMIPYKDYSLWHSACIANVFKSLGGVKATVLRIQRGQGAGSIANRGRLHCNARPKKPPTSLPVGNGSVVVSSEMDLGGQSMDAWRSIRCAHIGQVEYRGDLPLTETSTCDD